MEGRSREAGPCAITGARRGVDERWRYLYFCRGDWNNDDCLVSLGARRVGLLARIAETSGRDGNGGAKTNDKDAEKCLSRDRRREDRLAEAERRRESERKQEP